MKIESHFTQQRIVIPKRDLPNREIGATPTHPNTFQHWIDYAFYLRHRAWRVRKGFFIL